MSTPRAWAVIRQPGTALTSSTCSVPWRSGSRSTPATGVATASAARQAKSMISGVGSSGWAVAPRLRLVRQSSAIAAAQHPVLRADEQHAQIVAGVGHELLLIDDSTKRRQQRKCPLGHGVVSQPDDAPPFSAKQRFEHDIAPQGREIG